MNKWEAELFCLLAFSTVMLFPGKSLSEKGHSTSASNLSFMRKSHGQNQSDTLAWLNHRYSEGLKKKWQSVFHTNTGVSLIYFPVWSCWGDHWIPQWAQTGGSEWQLLHVEISKAVCLFKFRSFEWHIRGFIIGARRSTLKAIIHWGLLWEILEGSLDQASEGQERWIWWKEVTDRVRVDYRCDKMRAEGPWSLQRWGGGVCESQQLTLNVLIENLLCRRHWTKSFICIISFVSLLKALWNRYSASHFANGKSQV